MVTYGIYHLYIVNIKGTRKGHLHTGENSIYIYTGCTVLLFQSSSICLSVLGSIDLHWSWAASVLLIWAENMLYKAAVCLLEDITSLNLAVSLTEPRAFEVEQEADKRWRMYR